MKRCLYIRCYEIQMHNLHICIPPSSQPVPKSKFKKAFLFQPSAWLVFPCVQRYLQTETVSSISRRSITNTGTGGCRADRSEWSSSRPRRSRWTQSRPTCRLKRWRTPVMRLFEPLICLSFWECGPAWETCLFECAVCQTEMESNPLCDGQSALH